MAGRNVSYVKPPEPSFLRKLKEQVGFKEGPTVDTKKEDLPNCDQEDLDDRDDEKPVVVVLKPGDLSQEEVDAALAEPKEINKIDDSEDYITTDGRILFKKPTKRVSEEDPSVSSSSKKKKNNKPKSSDMKKVKNSHLLSFDEDDDDDN